MELNKRIFYLIISIQVFVLLCSSYFIRLDDAYIFYKYAKNLVEWNGYVFNLNEKINATTSFSYTILLALFCFPFQSNFEIALPLIGGIISVMSLIYTAFLLTKIFSEELKEAKFILPVILLSMPLIKNAIGMETFLKILSMMIFLYLYQKEKFILMSLVGAFLFITRPDTIILILITSISYFLKRKKLFDIKIISIFIIIVLTYLFASYFYFGRVIPSSLGVKIIQRDLKLINGNFFDGFVKTFPGGENVAIIFFTFFLFAILILCLKNKAIFKNELFQIILIYFIAFTLIYGLILNPPPYPWYYTDYIVLYSLIISFFLKIFIQKFKGRTRLSFLLSAIIIIFISGLLVPFKTIKTGYNEKFILYKNTAKFINSFSGENSKLATDEIGILGFYFKGKIIDELGLITPEAIDGIKQKNFLKIIETTKPDFVVVDFPEIPFYKSYINNLWFKNNYAQVYTLKLPLSGVRIFKRKSFDYKINSFLSSKHPTSHN